MVHIVNFKIVYILSRSVFLYFNIKKYHKLKAVRMDNVLDDRVRVYLHIYFCKCYITVYSRKKQQNVMC